MPEEHNGIWVEKMFKKIPIPYPVVSMIVASIIFSIFVFFSTRVLFFPLEFFHLLDISTLSVLIGYQLVGIQYILTKMKKTLKELSIDDLYLNFEHRLYNSKWYYLMVASVIIPFIIVDLRSTLRGITFYLFEPTIWSLLLDVYNYATRYFMLLLLATILWIIYNIIWILNIIVDEPFNRLIKIDIFSADNLGGLKPLKDFVLEVLVYYFICIALVMFSLGGLIKWLVRINLVKIFGYEDFFSIILLLVGVSFFFMSIGKIRKLVKGGIEDEINNINKLYKSSHQRLMDIVSEKRNYKEKEEELNYLSTTMGVLYTDRERMLELYKGTKGYDFASIVKLLGSFILSLIAFLKEILPPILKEILTLKP